MITDTELFDTTEYQIPYPTVDDQEVDGIAITIRGALKLNRNDPAHIALIEKLRLGRQVTLNCVATCTGKTHQHRTDNDNNSSVTHVASLAVDFIDIPE